MAISNVLAMMDFDIGRPPYEVCIITDDSLATVLTPGYLNAWSFPAGWAWGFTSEQLAMVITTDGIVWMKVDVGSPNISLVNYLNILTPSISTPTFNSSTTASQLSTTRPAQVSYSYNATVNISLLAGQSITATLKYADNSAMTTNPVTVDIATTNNSGVLGLTQINTLKLTGMIPPGKYRQVTFAVTGGATAPSALAAGQEALI